jgi:hypothetical protein
MSQQEKKKYEIPISITKEVHVVLSALKQRVGFPKFDSVIRYLMLHSDEEAKSEIRKIVEFMKVQGILLEVE